MSYNNYGGGSNPYDQRDAAPGGGYNSGGYGGNNRYAGRDSYGGQNVELEPLAQNGQQFGHQQDPNAILNECREIDKGIDAIELNLGTIRSLQLRALDDPDSSQQSATNSQLDSISSETMTMYRSFAARIKTLKQQPESGSPKNAPQLGKVDRKLKAAINQYQNVESDFRKKLQTQMARQYKIVRPDASEAEVREAVEDTSNQQVFSQALLQSDRRGQSRQALSNVQNRHAAIQKIESQMIELAQLFQDMEALVVQQEDSVTMIEQKGEEVAENLDKGTEHIGTAIKSARSRNRKKWYCLGILLIIIIIIVIVVVVVVLINKRDNGGGNNNNNNNKRGVLYNVHGHLAPTPGATIESLVAGLSKETVEQYANAVAKRALTWVG
ncbi:hypothetical protein V495_06588 [Pseudogymnoascus sp. VKM F-4514 (FW-929)]|nr:hypothetical protein V495_06588 [Pseudogymnoascus sp. VKM F-4514 (FW-929)]KFY51961.1 hypothetical protein V497_08722 [Pseudogymnoascus sp. VKM F-4516 (FW-969)]